MGQKLVVGPVSSGLHTDVLPFNINNDSFPTLVNAYQWRGRVKRKRGTSFLGRLQRYVSVTVGNTDGGGNFLTLSLASLMGLQSTANIVPGSFTAVVGANTYTETNPVTTNASGIDLLVNGVAAPPGTFLQYNTTSLGLVTGLPATSVTVTFLYYPNLPVLGIEDFVISTDNVLNTLCFDTTYSYYASNSTPSIIADISYYKNPGSSGGYVQKAIWTPVTWNGATYQQFWSCNYEGALFVTNGIDVPFTGNTIGLPAKEITGLVITVAGPPARAQFTVLGHNLVVGDFIYVNEAEGITGINFQTGYVVTVINGNNFIAEFPQATFGGAWTNNGIVVYLTNRPDTTKDCIRWIDGYPTNLNPNPPTFQTGFGWVNFCPPLSQDVYSISGLPAAIYYLVGARMILPFKDRLLFIGPVVQNFGGAPKYLQDTVVYSQNGTPYYTCSFTLTGTQSVTGADVVFTPVLVPTNQTATAPAYFSDSIGFGGFVSSGLSSPITTASPNEDVLILGHKSVQTRFVYTGNDIIPFNFYLVNSELGSNSTFSSITTDLGVITKGNRGFIITSQTGAARIDLEIPQKIFEISNNNNGEERVSAQRDFINEWIYFTYLSNDSTYVFPGQTLQYNYRDQSWAIFNESYTTYGNVRKVSGYTWANIGQIFPSWSVWNQPWNSGSTTLSQPLVAAGNQQGFICVRDQGTTEDPSLYIQSFSGNTVTAPNHGLNENDYIIITGCLGTVASQVNNKIFSVGAPTQNTFILNPNINAGTYFGSGTITRMYVPYIQTKQFPVSWALSRKTRLGPQQYLLTTTARAQIQLLIFLSQNSAFAYNDPAVNPNNSLIYSTVLYTCPESTNLGLTPYNSNLQTPTAAQQQQIWHRKNTSLIGDTVQIGFTLSDTQMRTVDNAGNPISQFAEIEIHGFILDVNPSQLLV